MVIERVATLLGITDHLQDELLEVLRDLTIDHFKAYTGSTDDVPEELEYIIVNVIVKRYNRIGAEGMTSQSVEGLSTSFDARGDFEEYDDVLKRRYSKNLGGGFKLL